MDKVIICITPEQFNIIGQALVGLPYFQVAQLIDELNKQVTEQAKAAGLEEAQG